MPTDQDFLTDIATMTNGDHSRIAKIAERLPMQARLQVIERLASLTSAIASTGAVFAIGLTSRPT